MKFVLALLVYIGFGVVLGIGILKAVHGNPWLLIATALVYAGLLVRIGCLSH
jgi:hypothetical protein